MKNAGEGKTSPAFFFLRPNVYGIRALVSFIVFS